MSTACRHLQPADDDHEPIVVLDDRAALDALPEANLTDRGQPPASVASMRATTAATRAVETTDTDDRLLLRDLTAYAQERLTVGDAAAALQTIGADVPDLVAAYGLGYLPVSYRAALPPMARPRLAGRRMAGCLWLPATDAQGIIVDALAIHARPNGGAYVGWHAEPRGLLGAVIATAYPDLIICDSLRLVAQCARRGLRQVLLMRGVADVAGNLPRLIAAGVRRVDLRVRRDADAYLRLLRAAGLVVQQSSTVLDAGAGHFCTPVVQPPEPSPETDPHAVIQDADAVPTSPAAAASLHASESPQASTTARPPLALVHHDQRLEMATYAAGAITLTVDVPSDDRTALDVTVRHRGQVHRDRVDLAVAASCGRFALCAAPRCDLAQADVTALLADLLPQVRALAASGTPARRASEPSSPAALTTAQDWLTAPDLLDRIAADCTTLGWVGDEEVKRLAYLVAISRTLSRPLWCQQQLVSGLGTMGLDVIADLTPPEDVLRVSRLTAAMLHSQKPDALRHALLIVDDGAAITDDAICALQILRQRGALAAPQLRRAGVQTQGQAADVRGPIALYMATTRHAETDWSATCLTLPHDDSAAQTARIIAAQRRAYGDQANAAAVAIRDDIRARHHALQRALACRPVMIACADRIVFPTSSVQDRRDHAQFLGIVAAHALLHQQQRLREGETVVADARDVTAAIRLATAVGLGVDRGLSAAARELLTACRSSGLTSITVRDAQDRHPTWTSYTARAVIAELLAAGHLTLVQGGSQGRRGVYDLTPTPIAATASGISRIRLCTEAEALQHQASNCSLRERCANSVTAEALCG